MKVAARFLTQSILLIGLLFSLTACDPVTWYANETLRTSEVTNEHVIAQQDVKIKVRMFRYAKQIIVELQFDSIPKERISLSKSDVLLVADGKNIEALGFTNLSEASVKVYKNADLVASTPLASGKKLAAVFADNKNNALELQLFGLNYRFTQLKSF